MSSLAAPITIGRANKCVPTAHVEKGTAEYVSSGEGYTYEGAIDIAGAAATAWGERVQDVRAQRPY